ncbi:RsfA family transcriptional regulator [Bacillus sp. V59.32b]|uniref:RsfA family transcriptional regulator n=1 Tax=Bacillus sp. V59.32b TaxID=1758642 RepID=UPI000E3E896F|nr:RsfA family transcriptional regulator [Bacillus sp. V59.32b]RFU67977.1 RsfA family transcriptional regulator [Bacillus sp. V59.32b]
MKVRQDAWTEEDDLLLAETVLRHVREGSTQLNAFEEVGDKLNRTSAACGFRWNAVVRHNYDKALQLAKKQRKQRQRILGKDQGGKKKLLYTPPAPTIEDIRVGSHQHESNVTELELESELEAETITYAIPETVAPANEARNEGSDSHTLTLDVVITYLQSMNTMILQAEVLKSENERLKLEMEELRKRNQQLEKKAENLEQNTGIIQEDYEMLMNIMNRARKLVLLEEDERPATKFKMDRNGNLEKLAE